MKYQKLIKKWARLRHYDPEFERTAIRLYESFDESDRIAMLKEFQGYIDGVKKGDIIPGPVSLPEIPKIKYGK